MHSVKLPLLLVAASVAVLIVTLTLALPVGGYRFLALSGVVVAAGQGAAITRMVLRLRWRRLVTRALAAEHDRQMATVDGAR